MDTIPIHSLMDSLLFCGYLGNLSLITHVAIWVKEMLEQHLKSQDLVAKVDMDGSGLLNFPEFLSMMGYKVKYHRQLNDIMEYMYELPANAFIP